MKKLLTIIALMLVLVCALASCNRPSDKSPENEKTHTTHSYTGNYEFDEYYHWLKCSECDEISKEYHALDDDGICTVCDAVVRATEGLVYELSADGTYATLIAYEGTATRITIADTYQGVPVTEIYREAFFENSSITSVIIPDSVTTICDEAFFACSSLTSVVIGDSVTTIGNQAFWLCSSLTSVVIPDSVTTIGSAFFYCSSLTSVVIPDSVTTIDVCAFWDCSSLTDVYYTGSEAQWAEISIGDDNFWLTRATKHYNYVPEEN